jgi:endonuclease/exonuclease/phosphatase (EEP) superfamily protein YafD
MAAKLKRAAGALAIPLCGVTLLSLLPRDEWWARIWDFPRLQVFGLLLANFGLLLAAGKRDAPTLVLGSAMVASLLYQGRMIAPYTPFVPQEVASATAGNPENELRLFTANVLMSNRNAGNLLEVVRSANADVLLFVETDAWWADELQTLAQEYPHVVTKPLSNTYGMMLFSRLPILAHHIHFRVEPAIPSIEATLALRSGQTVRLYGLHPRPPFPTESEDTAERDAELVLVGREVKAVREPVVVLGDLNDVAWSRTTRLFQKVSGLLDPRRGRGFYNSFHAQLPLLRFSLDHFFHSDDFQVVELRRLPAFGSDHFPLLIHLQYVPEEKYRQDEPAATPKVRADAAEKVRDAK